MPVHRSAFTPPPKVMSAVVHIVPDAQADGVRMATLEALTAAAFGQRRKMLRASLRGLPGALEAMEAEGIKPEARAETVPVEAFAKAVVAYEPVWAIGTGKTASPEQAQEIHAFMRGLIGERDATIADSLQLLYGGSMKASNAAQLLGMPDVDGGLVGGASLQADEFIKIFEAAA